VEQSIVAFIIVGFLAQMVDGALGMAYGVSSTTVLLSLGIPPAAASASVHTAEIFTTLVSGLSHLRFGNVDKRLLQRLLIPGILGGIAGACILTMVPGKVVKPFIALYLLVMGLLILDKALRKSQESRMRKVPLIPLGAAGGFFDAIGGGGWGPIVTSTLVAGGHNPRFTIGSVNLAEFFVTVSEVIAFIATIGLVHWQVIVGLLIGGVLAAPLAAYVCKKVPARTLMVLVGLLIVGLSIRTIVQIWW
jgi:uncharacterized membrane protein YfcA